MTASARLPLKLKRRRLSSKQKQLPNFALGAAGEARAQKFLAEHGFRILDVNCRWRLHEIDIVAVDEGKLPPDAPRMPGVTQPPRPPEVVFVEVKTRSTADFGSPSLAVGRAKLRSLIRAAHAYLRLHPELAEYDYRFDIVAILPGKIDHYPNITWEMVK